MMDGIVESAHCSDSTVASCSVACVVALLGSLEDLSQGRGLSDEHIEFLSQIKETDNWEEMYQIKNTYQNAASSRDVPKFTVSDETFEEDGKGKQLHWEHESEQRPSPEGDIGTVTERFMKGGNVWETNKEEEKKEINGMWFQDFLSVLLYYWSRKNNLTFSSKTYISLVSQIPEMNFLVALYNIWYITIVIG